MCASTSDNEGSQVGCENFLAAFWTLYEAVKGPLGNISKTKVWIIPSILSSVHEGAQYPIGRPHGLS